MIVGRMRERRMACHAIADRIDPPVAGLEFSTDDNSGLVVANSCGIKTETFDRGFASDGNRRR